MKPAPVVPLTDPVSILMPVCNEADVIQGVLEEWIEDVVRHLPPGSEFVLEDGNSTDGTREILRALAAKHSFLRIIEKPMRDGFAAAARRLYNEARCPWVFFTDSDGQYIAADFWKVARYAGQYDLIHGSKIGRKDPWLRRYASAVFNKLTWFFFGVPYLDVNSAFRLMRTDMVRDILPRTTCMPTLLNTELLLRAELENYTIKQVYVLHRVRKFGVSRGLPPSRFAGESWRAFIGLLNIKKSYRTDG